MGDWLRRRRDRAAARDAAMQRLAEEYHAKLEAGDPDALEASRNYYDNDGGSTRFESE